MKDKSIWRKITASVLTAAMAVAIAPMKSGENIAYADTTKNAGNTCLGTSLMAYPAAPVVDLEHSWNGSFVYYGIYDGNPILFRVLDPHSTAYGRPSLFLDSERTLFAHPFSHVTKYWEDCELKVYLNSTFVDDAFTSIEAQAINTSFIAEHELVVGEQPGQVSQYAYDTYRNFVGLNYDRIFCLDAEELSNIAYGYTTVPDADNYNRRKHSAYTNSWGDDFFIRSHSNDPQAVAEVGYVSFSGSLNTYLAGESLGVAPAMNVLLSDIVFSTLISGNFNEVGAVYKLTIIDPDLGIAVPLGQQITMEISTVTVPYVFSGDHAGNATRASVLITDGEWDADGSSILLYEALGETNAATSGTFDLPSGCDPDGWGADYHVYILAEDINDGHDGKETDYASAPVEIPLSSVRRTYNIAVNNGSSDAAAAFPGTTVTITAEPPAAFREFAQWDVVSGSAIPEDPGAAVTTFVMPSSHVELSALYMDIMYNVNVNNGSSNVSSAVHGATVTITAEPPPAGQEFDRWELVSGTVTLNDPTSPVTTFTMTAEDVVVTAAYRDIEYTISVTNGSSNVTTATMGDTITITADPASPGRMFDHWEIVPGAVPLTNASSATTTFTMPTEDVQLTAFYRDIPVSQYSVTVNNGSADATTANQGATITLTADAAPEGKVFDRWVVIAGAITLANASSATTTFTMPAENVEVTATYRDTAVTTHTVTFETNGGTAVAAQTIADGSKAVQPSDPARDGFTFEGWYQDEACTLAFDFDTAVTSDMTLYARWGSAPASGGVVPGTGEKIGSEAIAAIICFILAMAALVAALIVRKNRKP